MPKYRGDPKYATKRIGTIARELRHRVDSLWYGFDLTKGLGSAKVHPLEGTPTAEVAELMALHEELGELIEAMNPKARKKKRKAP